MGWWKVAIVCTVSMLLVGCAPSTPSHPGSPPARSFSGSCPSALGTAHDVAAPADVADGLIAGDARPSSGIVCDYGSVFDQGPGPHRTLAKQIDLSGTAARELAAAAARIDVRVAAAPAGCPDDDGRVTVITFRWIHSAPVALWWHAAGCQSIDNGEVRAEQVANDSFARFQTVFAAVTRPVASHQAARP